MLKDLMNRNPVSVLPDTKVASVARLMSEQNVGAVLVCVDGHCKGIVTDRDIVLRCVAQNVDVNDCTIEQICSEPIESVRETDGIYDCIRKMRTQEVRRMPVVDSHGDVTGVISFDDLLAFLSREIADLAEAATATSLMAKPVGLRAA
jgi:CBS domain-containing protein